MPINLTLLATPRRRHGAEGGVRSCVGLGAGTGVVFRAASLELVAEPRGNSNSLAELADFTRRKKASDHPNLPLSKRDRSAVVRDS